MRLSELLKEQEESEIRKWYKEWTTGQGNEIEHYLTDDDKPHPKWAKAMIWSGKPHQLFDPPMDRSWWKNNPELNEFSITQGGSEGSDYSTIITNFEKIPDVKTLAFAFVDIKSLKGIESLHQLTELQLYSHTIFDCGLLRLLKNTSLRKFETWGLGDALKTEKDEKNFDAIKIVEKYLTSKNIPECQQELIEEGLQEFAKL